MERIGATGELTETEVEALFRERAESAIAKMDVPRFSAAGLAPARSEKEIAKCVKLAEKAEHKSELRRRDAEAPRPKRRRDTGPKPQRAGTAKRMKMVPKHPKPAPKKGKNAKQK